MLLLIVSGAYAVHQLAVLDSVYTSWGRNTKKAAQVKVIALLQLICSGRKLGAHLHMATVDALLSVVKFPQPNDHCTASGLFLLLTGIQKYHSWSAKTYIVPAEAFRGTGWENSSLTL